MTIQKNVRQDKSIIIISKSTFMNEKKNPPKQEQER